MLISRMSRLNKEHIGLVVVHRIPLVYQHAQNIEAESDLTVLSLCSENISNANIHKIVQRGVDVVVITAGSLIEQLNRNTLSLELFHTLILDECHNASGNHD